MRALAAHAIAGTAMLLTLHRLDDCMGLILSGAKYNVLQVLLGTLGHITMLVILLGLCMESLLSRVADRTNRPAATIGQLRWVLLATMVVQACGIRPLRARTQYDSLAVALIMHLHSKTAKESFPLQMAALVAAEGAFPMLCHLLVEPATAGHTNMQQGIMQTAWSTLLHGIGAAALCSVLLSRSSMCNLESRPIGAVTTEPLSQAPGGYAPRPAKCLVAANRLLLAWMLVVEACTAFSGVTDVGGLFGAIAQAMGALAMATTLLVNGMLAVAGGPVYPRWHRTVNIGFTCIYVANQMAMVVFSKMRTEAFLFKRFFETAILIVANGSSQRGAATKLAIVAMLHLSVHSVLNTITVAIKVLPAYLSAGVLVCQLLLPVAQQFWEPVQPHASSEHPHVHGGDTLTTAPQQQQQQQQAFMVGAQGQQQQHFAAVGQQQRQQQPGWWQALFGVQQQAPLFELHPPAQWSPFGGMQGQGFSSAYVQQQQQQQHPDMQQQQQPQWSSSMPGLTPADALTQQQQQLQLLSTCSSPIDAEHLYSPNPTSRPLTPPELLATGSSGGSAGAFRMLLPSEIAAIQSMADAGGTGTSWAGAQEGMHVGPLPNEAPESTSQNGSSRRRTLALKDGETLHSQDLLAVLDSGSGNNLHVLHQPSQAHSHAAGQATNHANPWGAAVAASGNASTATDMPVISSSSGAIDKSSGSIGMSMVYSSDLYRAVPLGTALPEWNASLMANPSTMPSVVRVATLEASHAGGPGSPQSSVAPRWSQGSSNEWDVPQSSFDSQDLDRCKQQWQKQGSRLEAGGTAAAVRQGQPSQHFASTAPSSQLPIRLPDSASHPNTRLSESTPLHVNSRLADSAFAHANVRMAGSAPSPSHVGMHRRRSPYKTSSDILTQVLQMEHTRHEVRRTVSNSDMMKAMSMLPAGPLENLQWRQGEKQLQAGDEAGSHGLVDGSVERQDTNYGGTQVHSQQPWQQQQQPAVPVGHHVVSYRPAFLRRQWDENVRRVHNIHPGRISEERSDLHMDE